MEGIPGGDFILGRSDNPDFKSEKEEYIKDYLTYSDIQSLLYCIQQR